MPEAIEAGSAERGECELEEEPLKVQAPTLPGMQLRPTSQPFAPLGRMVQDYKAKQMKDAS